MDLAALTQAFRLLQSGDALAALEAARRLVAAEPTAPRAHLVAGMALRALGRLDEAKPALERACALDARDYAAAYELGLLRDLLGDGDGALADFERAMRLRPGFAPAIYAAGVERLRRRDWGEAAERFAAVLSVDPGNADAVLNRAAALFNLGRADEADAQYRKALERDPDNAALLRAHGQLLVARGEFAAAAQRFAASAERLPEDHDLRIFLAQTLLATGRWREGWEAYSHRATRRRHFALRAQQGSPYRIPAVAEMKMHGVRIVAEQGLGDILFFLRFAAPLRESGVRLAFAGDVRLHPLLARTGLFEVFEVSSESVSKAWPVEILSADLPRVVEATCPPALPMSADPARVEAWRRELERSGPRPWLGVTWRAGTPGDVLAHGLHKTIPMATLFTALRPLGGSVFALQRAPVAGEIDSASDALGARVHDVTRMNDDLEDALALLAILDRHVGVSNTNMHLAAALGRTADVLVPFPPEWRWGTQGPSSPWYPGFRVLRQKTGGDWTDALAALGP